MVHERDSHCHRCGARYPQITSYPRVCGSCQNQVWANPLPVSVVLVPVAVDGGVRSGLLVVRRSIEPRKGLLALVGGFLEEQETWQEGGAREIREETGVVVDPATLAPFWFTSTEPKPNRVLLFSTAAPLDVARLPPFTPSNETSERGLVFGPGGLDSILAFPLHSAAIRRYFQERGVEGEHRYTQV
ncbi:MAG: NUDIX domain-containing protein [Polyangiaceae bacterium]